MDTKQATFDLYGDFTCPWVYQASLLLKRAEEAAGRPLRWTFRYFALDQVNQKNGPDWRLWEHPETPSRGLHAFRAAEAARRQGEEAFERMRWSLMEGRHLRRKEFSEPGDMEEIARAAGLDMARFHKDVRDPAILARLAEDHTRGAKLGIFGTPTFVFENGSAFFLRITAGADPKEALKTWDGLHALFVSQMNIDEVKRPRPSKP